MDPRLDALEKQLVDQARGALALRSFEARNEQHSRSVAHEGAVLAAAAGVERGTDAEGRLFAVFNAAAQEAGAAFAPAFASDGSKRADGDRAYQDAINAAGPVAYRHLVAERPSAGSVLAMARLGDLSQLFSHLLGLAGSVTEPELAAAIGRVVPRDDSFFDEIEKGLPTRTASDAPLSPAELSTLELGLRLAHATWKSGQVHRAAWEGSDKRIDPRQRISFLPYDALLRRRYDDVLAAHRDEPDAAKLALGAVVFEAYKDLLELEKARRAQP